MQRLRNMYRYVGKGDLINPMGFGERVIKPGRFISEALYKQLPEEQTIRQQRLVGT